MKDNYYKNDYNKKIIEIIRDKKYKFVWTTFYLSTVEKLIWKNIFF
jgi:hypothetical protein